MCLSSPLQVAWGTRRGRPRVPFLPGRIACGGQVQLGLVGCGLQGLRGNDGAGTCLESSTDLPVLMGGRRRDGYSVSVWSGSYHVVFCVTFGDEPKFTSILWIPQTPKGHLLCALNLVRRNQADLTGKCRSLPVQNQAVSYVF